MLKQREYWKFADSSWISEAWWDEETRSLEVEFTDGVRWEYDDVSKYEWTRFKMVESAGRYVNQVLNRKPNRSL